MTKFWTDKWLSCPIVDIMQMPCSLHNSLKAFVSDFTNNKSLSIPSFLSSKFPILAGEIQQVPIPWFPRDELVGAILIQALYHTKMLICSLILAASQLHG